MKNYGVYFSVLLKMLSPPENAVLVKKCEYTALVKMFGPCENARKKVLVKIFGP